MNPLLPVALNRRYADWRLAMKSIIAFWLVYAVTVVARALLGGDPWTVLQNKAVTVGAGICLTIAIYLMIGAVAGHKGIGRKAVVAGIAIIFAAIAQAALLVAADSRMPEPKEEFRFQAREGFVVIQNGSEIRIERTATEPLVLTLPKIAELKQRDQLRIAADAAVIWFFFFAAWSAFYLAILSQAQALGAQRRVAEAEAAAQAAQVRALRYQVNPHFLFNTLNSLSSLIMTGRPEKAEKMLLALSTFFRTSLSLDPTANVTLAEEIGLQRLYLDIEKVRFPKRLKVEIDVPVELEQVRLPALLLQPIVENAIKYGVSASRDTVALRITARRLDHQRMLLEVINQAVAGAHPAPQSTGEIHQGTGVGLANVCQRLRASFGDRARCDFGPTDDGGFRVAIIMPVVRDD